MRTPSTPGPSYELPLERWGNTTGVRVVSVELNAVPAGGEMTAGLARPAVASSAGGVEEGVVPVASAGTLHQ